MARELGLTVAQGAKLLGTYGLGAGIAGALCGGMVADWLRRHTATGRVITDRGEPPDWRIARRVAPDGA